MHMVKKYIKSHIVITPYSMSIQKCGKASCTICTPFKSSDGIRDLVLQRQTTPQKKDNEHFLSRQEASSKYEGQEKVLTNFECLPSKAITKRKPPKQRSVKETQVYEN